MSKFEIELNSSGIRELLQSEEMRKEVEKWGRAVQQVANADERPDISYDLETSIRGDRACATVKAGTAHAYYSNLKHNTLLKALGSVKE